MTAHELLRGVRKETGDLLLLGVASNTDNKLAERVVAHAPGEGRKRIDRHARGLELADLRFNYLEMIFQAGRFWIGTDDFEQAVLLHLFKINAPTGRIAQQLGPGFLIGKQNRPLPAAASILNKLGNQQGLARTGGTGGQND